jgi:hypothetical protein
MYVQKIQQKKRLSMDDLYTPIDDMPGDTGVSSSASGMINNPLQKSRYAKKNDIIQKYQKPSGDKYIAKSANIRKLKIPKSWADEIIGSRVYSPDTGGMRGFGSTDADKARREAEISAAERILAADNPFGASRYSEKLPRSGTVTYSPTDISDFATDVFNAGVRSTQPAWEARLNRRGEEGRLSGLTEGEAKARADASRQDSRGRYGVGGFKDLLYDFTPLPEIVGLSRQIGDFVKPTIVGKPKEITESRLPGADSMTPIERARQYSIYNVADKRSMNPKMLEDEYLRYISDYPNASLSTQNIQQYDTRKPAKARNKTIGETFKSPRTMGADLEDIRQREDWYRNADGLTDQARIAGGKILPTAGRLGVKAGIYYGVGRPVWDSLFGNKYVPDATVVPVQEETRTATPIVVQPTPMTRYDDNEFSPPPPPQQYKLPSGELGKSMKKRSGFAKSGGKKVKDLLDEIAPDVALLSNPSYRDIAEGRINQAYIRYGVDPTKISAADLNRLYGTWDLDDLTRIHPYTPVVAKPPRKTKKNPKGWDTVDTTYGVPGSTGGDWVSRMRNNQRVKQFGNFARNPWGAAALGATGGSLATIGGLMSLNSSDNPEPSAGDVNIPNITYVPTVTPTKQSTSNQKSEPTQTPIPVAANARQNYKNVKQWASDVQTDEARKEEKRRKAAAEKLEDYNRRVVTPAIADALRTYEWESNLVPLTSGKKRFEMPAYQSVATIPHDVVSESRWRKLKNPYNLGYDKAVLDYQPSFKKSSKNVRKATSVPFQGSSLSQTSYIKPTTKARYDSMTPEQQGAALVNSIAENTKQNYRNAKEYLNNIARFTSGAINAADQQTKFSTKIVPQAKEITNTVIIPKSKEAYRYGKDVAIPYIVEQSKRGYEIGREKGVPALLAGKEYVVNSVKEIARNNPEIAQSLSTKKIQSSLNQMIKSSPEIQKNVAKIGQNILNSINATTQTVRAKIFGNATKRMSKKQNTSYFSKRLETPTKTQAHKNTNKYF